MLIGGATPSREETSVERAPVDRFHCSLMLSESGERLVGGVRSDLPHHQFIIISSRGENFIIVGTPSQTTDLLLMAL